MARLDDISSVIKDKDDDEGEFDAVVSARIQSYCAQQARLEAKIPLLQQFQKPLILALDLKVTLAPVCCHNETLGFSYPEYPVLVTCTIGGMGERAALLLPHRSPRMDPPHALLLKRLPRHASSKPANCTSSRGAFRYNLWIFSLHDSLVVYSTHPLSIVLDRIIPEKTLVNRYIRLLAA